MASEVIDWIEEIVLFHENKTTEFLSAPQFNTQQDINVRNA